MESSAGSQRTHATGKSAQSTSILCDGFIISVVTSLRGFVSSQSTRNVSSFRVVLFVSKEGRGKDRGEKIGRSAQSERIYALRENRVRRFKLDDTFSDRGMFFNLFKYSTNYSLSFLSANGKVLDTRYLLIF